MKKRMGLTEYQEGLAKGQLHSLLCHACGSHTIPPQGVCSNCGGLDLEVKSIPPEGVVKTFTVIRVAAEGWTPPFVVALVETSSGAWIMGNIVGIDPDTAGMDLIGKSVTIGNRVVKGDAYATTDLYIPTFRPA